MLIQLTLKNIALIEIIEINFEKGLNIFTGDSGSGKSLILDSLNVLFGGSNIPLNHLIRPGKEECLIEAKFSNSSQSQLIGYREMVFIKSQEKYRKKKILYKKIIKFFQNIR
jgi:DNA repair protein RecN (Recombination protein N)